MDGLLIAAADAFSWFSPASWLAILKVVLGLGAVIFVHELGHFLVAKACGVKCEKFYLGFDAFDIRIGDFVLVPRRLFHFQWGETEYGIGIIPLGGYVKMLGQDDNPANAARERERSMKLAEEQGDDSKDGESGADSASEAPYELDPRSYQAKSVPQRMAIISAGVIMNMIFAVIFAATAYMIGAPYEPCVIGNVLPGGPAWVEDVQPGSEVVQIGEDGERREHLRFQRDLVSAIAFNGAKRDIHLFMRVPGDDVPGDDGAGDDVPADDVPADDAVKEYTLRPRTDLLEYRGAELAQIGIGPSSSMEFGEPAVMPDTAAGAADIQPGDKITAFTIDERTINDPTYAQLKTELARYPNKPVTFSIERPQGKGETPQTLQVTVAPNPTRFVGMDMKISPIVAIQTGSPAAKAGMQAGDVILSIDGQPIGNPFTLEDRMLDAAREQRSVPIVVQRSDDGESDREVELTVQPRLPRTRYSSMGDAPIAVDELGIAFKVLAEVAEVVPGSSAAQQGIQPGDKIKKVQFIPANDEQRAKEVELGFQLEELPLKKLAEWPIVFNGMQQHLLDTRLKITYERDAQEKTAELEITPSDKYFQRTRGMFLTMLEDEHQAASIPEALALGWRETYENAMLVFSFLKKLVTAEISPINLGGPGTIAVTATHEAMFGTARLLLFLTLLSANLAVVNFLPIPVLDGGHMVFLAWEAIFRKPLSEKVMVALSMAGLLFIVGLMLFVISLDFYRLLPGG